MGQVLARLREIFDLISLEIFFGGFMAKKTARKKAQRKAKIRSGRQQQRQNPKIAARRKAKKAMRNRKHS
jgi:hypothetical protein